MKILVASCRNYSDAWTPFTTLFDRFWPGCDYPRVIYSDRPDVMPAAVTETNGFMPRIGSFYIHEIHDEGWNRNLLNVLRGESVECVAVFQEDFFVCYPVNGKRIREIEIFLIDSDYDCCRLYPCPGGDENLEIYPGIGEIGSMAPYRASCQVAIWKRPKLIELLERLLANRWNKIQEFEINGSRLIDDFKLCGVIRKGHPETWPLCYHCSAIANGRWMQGAIKFCQEQGVPLSKREIVFASDADRAILSGGYYEWLNKCMRGEVGAI
jgi:hypothetical protein